MVSKKQALILGAVAIAGTGVGLMMLGKGEDNGEDEGEEKTKKEFLIEYSAPVYAPTDIYSPYTETTITDIVHKLTTLVNPPTPDIPPVSVTDYQGYGSLDAMLKGHSQEKVSKKIARLKEEGEAAGSTSTAAERSAARYAALEELSRGGGGGAAAPSTKKPAGSKKTTRQRAERSYSKSLSIAYGGSG